MKTTALIEAEGWYAEIRDHLHDGWTDNKHSALHKVARRTGLPISYINRLQYKARDMRDIGGEAYRRLKLAYEELCEKNEAAADGYRAERQRLKEGRDAIVEERASASMGKDSARD